MKQRWLFSGRYNEYSWKSFKNDLFAGLIVGVIAIPLGMAFAIAAGVKPEYGLYTTIIAGILISLFGGSKYQIGGPTGAFIPVLFGIVVAYGYDNLLVAGFLAGLILLLMGMFKLGSLIKFIPRPVILGFTAGIAIIIFTGQIAYFLGLKDVERHESFFSNIQEIITHIQSINLYSVLTAVICLMALLLVPKLFPKIPGSLVGLLLSTVIANLFYPSQIATIGTTFGEISSSLPEFAIPEITFQQLQQLIGPAFVIAMLGSIESLLSAVVADGMTREKHHSNRELIGQGMANIVTPLFGGIPATGAIARTATNIKNGAVSPFSGVIHSITVLVVLILLAPYASTIPLASMAPILMAVAWNMSEKHHFYHLLKTKTSDSLVLIVTFLLTIFVNLTVAVEVGLLLAIVFFIKHMSGIMISTKVFARLNIEHEQRTIRMIETCRNHEQMSIYHVEGPLFFGAAQTFERSLENAIIHKPQILLLEMQSVPFIDTTGEYYLSRMITDFSKDGVVLISGLKQQPKNMLSKTGLANIIGESHFFQHTSDAIDFALSRLKKSV
ncbi:sulfate permease [Bacillus sp. FSL W7-1360]